MSVEPISSRFRFALGEYTVAATDYANHCVVNSYKRKLVNDSGDVLNGLCVELKAELQIVSSEIEPLTEDIVTLDKESTRLEELIAKKKEEIAELEQHKNRAVRAKEQLKVKKDEAVSNITQLRELIASAKRTHVVVQSNGGKSYTYSLFPCAAS